MITHDRKNKLDFFHSRDQSHPLNTFYEGEEAFDGIITDRRSCTDIFCLIIFFIFNAALVFYSQKGMFLKNKITYIHIFLSYSRI